MGVTYKSIGIIHSEHKNRKGTPIQAALAGSASGFIELNPEYESGLKDLGGFSHVILLYHFSPVFDHRENCQIGWMEQAINNEERYTADNRFSKNE